MYGTVAVQAALAPPRPDRARPVDRPRPLRHASSPSSPTRRPNYLIGGRSAAAPRQRPSQHRALPGLRGRRRPAGHRLRQRRPVRPALPRSGSTSHRDPRFRQNPRPPRAPRRGDRRAGRAARAAPARRTSGRDGRAPAFRPDRSTPSPRPSPSRRRWRAAWCRISAARAAPRSPMRFSDAELARDRPPPRLDEHGAAIRAALADGADWP